MKTKNFNLVNAADVWQVAGLWNVLKYESSDASGDVPSIRVRDASGSIVDVECKIGRFIELAAPAEGLIIQSLTGGPVTGKISIGVGKVSDSILTGSVSLTGPFLNSLVARDERDNDGRGGSAFVAVLTAANTTPNSMAVQLLNNAGNILVDQIYLTSSVVLPSLALMLYNTPLATAAGVQPTGKSSYAAADASAIARQQTNGAAIVGATNIHNLGGPDLERWIRFDSPFLLGPGVGIIAVASGAPTGNMTAAFHYRRIN